MKRLGWGAQPEGEKLTRNRSQAGRCGVIAFLAPGDLAEVSANTFLVDCHDVIALTSDHGNGRKGGFIGPHLFEGPAATRFFSLEFQVLRVVVGADVELGIVITAQEEVIVA